MSEDKNALKKLALAAERMRKVQEVAKKVAEEVKEESSSPVEQ